MIKRFLSLSVLLAMLWGCCSVEDTPRTAEKPDSPEQIYTVTYKSDYGTVPSEITGLKKGDKLTAEQLPVLTTDGYTFTGWYNGESEVTTEYKISSDLNLTAKWSVNTYTVKFNANGGNGEMTDMSFNYNEEQALTANTFTREGYTFAGWATTANGDVTYADGQKVSNLTAEDKATVTLYAVWNENDKVLPVIFSVASETAVDYGDSVTLSCDTEGVKISYTIDGVTAEYTDAIVITKDVTITAFATKDGMKKSDTTTASYTVKTYTVTYTTEYGVAPSKIVGLKKGDTLTEAQLAGITTVGYAFAGWYNGENEVTTEYKISSDVELTAKWNVNTYTVKFDANGGNGKMADMSFKYNEEKALTANTFTREDYTFAGWATTTDGTATYADMAKVKNLTAEDKATVILYAVWTKNGTVSPVIFSVPSETAVDYNDSVTLSCKTEGAKISYTIDGVTVEYSNAIVITKDVTITAFATKDGMKDSDESTASYTVKTYTVTYTTEYGVAPSKIDGLKKGDKLTAEELPKLITDGYTFAGWYNGENEVMTEYKISSDLNLTAKWNADTDTAYTVEHYQQNIADDEYILAETDTETGTTGENTSAEAKTYAGFTAKSVTQEKIAADGSTVVKIYYDRNTITLILDLDGGEGETEITGKYGAAVTTPANPTKIGYTFAGWNPDLPVTLPAENATYTAKWTANNYIVKFEANGGSEIMTDQVFTYDMKQALTANTFTCEDYEFAGWATSADGEKVYTDGQTVLNLTSENNATVILYAVWEIENYTITYNLNGGTNAESNPTSYTVETDTIILANATRNGYAFLGWYDENGDKVTQIPSDTAKDITVTAKWWYSVNFVYVQGATITGVIPGDGYKDSGIFKAGETVTVGDFYMCDHEVTQAEYEKYCTYGGDEEPETNGYNYPAYYVNWFDALVYCNKRSIAEGLTPCYTINDSINPTYWGSIPDSEDHANFNSWMAVTCNFEANGYRLPKEAEWEYAARGGNGLTGYQYSHAGCSHTVDDVAWYNNNSKYSSNKVKGKKANGLGLYDMSGNVSEWCWDAYYISSRYLRGGSWNYPGNYCTVSYRDHISAYYRDSSKGFRVVRTAE